MGCRGVGTVPGAVGTGLWAQTIQSVDLSVTSLCSYLSSRSSLQVSDNGSDASTGKN